MDLVSLLPMTLISVPLAIGNYYLAKKLKRRKWAWAGVSVVPIVGFFFVYYVMYVFAIEVPDRLEPLRKVQLQEMRLGERMTS